jgi:hypothetical protein
MDARVRTLTKYAKEYDGDLFFKRDSNGVIHLFRNKRRLKHFTYQTQAYSYTVDDEQHIFSLTIDWKPESRGVEWGIDPVMRKITAMDNWRDDRGYDEFCKRRDAANLAKRKQFKEHIRAGAEDMRSAFAKATNDITIRAGNKRK